MVFTEDGAASGIQFHIPASVSITGGAAIRDTLVGGAHWALNESPLPHISRIVAVHRIDDLDVLPWTALPGGVDTTLEVAGIRARRPEGEGTRGYGEEERGGTGELHGRVSEFGGYFCWAKITGMYMYVISVVDRAT